MVSGHNSPISVEVAKIIALANARDCVVDAARILVHSRKIADHITDKTDQLFDVSQDVWVRNWTELVSAVDYVDDLSTVR